MPFARSHRLGGLILVGGAFVLGAWLPTACNRGDSRGPGGRTDAGATGGATNDAAGLDQPGGSGANVAAGAGGKGTGSGGAGMGGRDGGVAASDASVTDAFPTDQDAAGQAGSEGSATDGGGMGAPDATVEAFPCGPCGNHWICGGSPDAGPLDIMLTREDDGCYLAGLSGHKLLGSDGTVTEGGAVIAKAIRFGPQVGLYYPDGTQWRYCAATPLCPAQP